MPCELKFKLSNMAHQLHTLQLVLHATWPMDLALPLCAAPPSGTPTALWTSHSSLRTSSVSISGSLVGLFSSWWCPALSSQRVFRRPPSWPYHSKMQELDSLFFPLALSALPCLSWHPLPWFHLPAKRTAWPLLGASEFWLRQCIAVSSS